MTLIRNFKRFFNKALRQPLYAISVLISRLTARFHYTFSDGKSALPESITLFLTHRCNLHCKMCGQWGDGGVTKKAPAGFIKSELSFESIRSLVDDIAAFHPSMTLFGGEPLLHPRIIDIISYVKSRGLHCLVITNGSLLGPIAADIVSVGLDELNVSLDGDSRLHDEIRGMSGLFDTIMDALKRVAEAKRRLGKRRPLVNLQCTITRHNFDGLEGMIDVARRAGADSLTFHNLIFTDRSLIERQKRYDDALGASSADWEGFVFDPGIDPEALYDKMRRILSKKYPFSVDLYPNFSKEAIAGYYRDPEFGLSNAGSGYSARCMSPWLAAYIFPDGEIRPCLNSTYSYGNIKDEPFRKIWNSEKAIAFRRALKGAGKFPLCARCTELYRY